MLSCAVNTTGIRRVLSGLNLLRTAVRNAALAIALLSPVTAVAEPVNNPGGRVRTCPGPDLELYTSRPHATEKGIRRRCALLDVIHEGGGMPPGDVRDQVRNELANQYAVEIDFSGRVGLPRRAVDYLLENMPEAAALVSAYSGKDYRATETDVANGLDRFFVTNNDSFAANFTFLFSYPRRDASEHMFFESGFAKVLFWRVWGNSFIHYHLRPVGVDASRYDIRVYVFTGSRLLKAVLSSGPFRYFSNSMFKDILDDIESAVGDFVVDPNPDNVLPPYFVSGLKTRLEAGDWTPRERRIPHQYEGGR